MPVASDDLEMDAGQNDADCEKRRVPDLEETCRLQGQDLLFKTDGNAHEYFVRARWNVLRILAGTSSPGTDLKA